MEDIYFVVGEQSTQSAELLSIEYSIERLFTSSGQAGSPLGGTLRDVRVFLTQPGTGGYGTKHSGERNLSNRASRLCDYG